MVDLLVYTNHRMGDIYYNTPFPHNVLSIVTVLIFFWGSLLSEKSVCTTRYWWNRSYFDFGSRCSRLGWNRSYFDFGSRCSLIMSEVNANVKKKVLCWTRYMSDNDVCWTRGQGQKKRVSFFRTFWFCGNRCSHIEGARHIVIPEVS